MQTQLDRLRQPRLCYTRGELFTANDGSLYRVMPDGEQFLIREPYKRHFGVITNTLQLRATLRAGEFTFPGGYRLVLHTSTLFQ